MKSGIGIGNIFLQENMSNHEGILKMDVEKNDEFIHDIVDEMSKNTKISSTPWKEMIGTLKSIPEDFIVKEIASVEQVSIKDVGLKMASLTNTNTIPIEEITENEEVRITKKMRETQSYKVQNQKKSHDLLSQQNNAPNGNQNLIQKQSSSIIIASNNSNYPQMNDNCTHNNTKMDNIPLGPIEQYLSLVYFMDHYCQDSLSKISLETLTNENATSKNSIDLNHNDQVSNVETKLTLITTQKKKSNVEEILKSISDLHIYAQKYIQNESKRISFKIDNADKSETTLIPHDSVHDSVHDSDYGNENKFKTSQMIWIPPIDTNRMIEKSQISDMKDADCMKSNQMDIEELHSIRRNFHQSIRKSYPFLKTNTYSITEKEKLEQQIQILQTHECTKGLDLNDDMKKHPRNMNCISSMQTIQTSTDTFDLTKGETNNDDKNEKSISTKETNTIASDKKKNKWLSIELDDMFFTLIPYLLFPLEDLLALYQFRNMGVVDIPKNVMGNRIHKHRKQYKRSKLPLSSPSSFKSQNENDTISSTIYEVLLHIKPTIDDKDTRRSIHHIISSAYKSFETSTRIVSISLPSSIMNKKQKQENDTNCIDYSNVTAIVVRWSRHAHRQKNKNEQKRERKQKRKHQTTSNDDIAKDAVSNHEFITRCVLQKRQVEHLTCIHHLSNVLKCRPSDIGTAGIKDMCAVTTQFVTFRNIKAKTLITANSKWNRYGIDVGNFERLPFFNIGYGHEPNQRQTKTNNSMSNNASMTNMLSRGDLSGNYFEITMRNMIMMTMNDKSNCYTLHSTTKSCLDAFVHRIKSNGFINYYGEQRVGEAGPTDKVGIRPYDIGRAMLQEKYDLAIDYLMQGRKKTFRAFNNDSMTLLLSNQRRYCERNCDSNWTFVENESTRKARDLWITSNKNASVVLKHMSSSKECKSMTRERSVLQGLKRYGKDKSLEALQCLHFNIRFFWINAYQSYVWNIAATKRIQWYGTKTVMGDLFSIMENDERGNQKKVIRTVDTEHLLSKVKFSSIVLPLPGHDVIYPQNKIGDIYQQILKEDGIVFDKSKIMESTARGSYRNIIAMAHELKWECVTMESNDNYALKNSEGVKDEKKKDENDCSRIEKDSTVKAAKFSFRLDSGSYATMMFRELQLTRL